MEKKTSPQAEAKEMVKHGEDKFAIKEYLKAHPFFEGDPEDFVDSLFKAANT